MEINFVDAFLQTGLALILRLPDAQKNVRLLSVLSEISSPGSPAGGVGAHPWIGLRLLDVAGRAVGGSVQAVASAHH